MPSRRAAPLQLPAGVFGVAALAGSPDGRQVELMKSYGCRMTLRPPGEAARHYLDILVADAQ